MSRKCTASRKDGFPCQGWALRESDPPLCAAHSRPVPPLEKRPDSTTLPDMAVQIVDLDGKIRQLSRYIDRQVSAGEEELAAHDYTAYLSLYGQLLSRLGRLMRDNRAITGEAADGIAGAIGRALDELGSEWGIEL